MDIEGEIDALPMLLGSSEATIQNRRALDSSDSHPVEDLDYSYEPAVVDGKNLLVLLFLCFHMSFAYNSQPWN